MKSENQKEHVSVLADEALSFFADRKIHVFFEGTVGAGGHSKAFLQAHPEIHTYLGCDADPEALAIAEQTLEPWKHKVELIHGNFSQLDQMLKERKIQSVDGFFLTWEFHLCN
jgi:16S rRNA (cytosine1402-N4)-methyltransferase